MRTFSLAALFIGVALLVWLRIGSVFAGPSLPPWIVSVAPIGKAQSITQIRVLFARDVAPLGAIDDPARASILSQFRIDPAVPGRFILLTPRMIGFEPSRALPLSTRVRVTLRAGARDLAGDTLLHDLTWTFHTPRLAFTDLPSLGPREYPEITPSPLEPVIRIQANTDVIETSLASHAVFIASDSGELVGVRLVPGTVDDKSHSYDLVPVKSLRPDSQYELRIAAGVLPKEGNLASNSVARGFLKTYGSFRATEIRHDIIRKRLYTRIGSPWFADGDPGIVFTNPIDATSLAGHIAIEPTRLRSTNLFTVLVFRPDVAMIDPEMLQPKTTYRVRIGPGIRDVYGQVLGTETTLTFTTGDLEPTLRAPQGNATLVTDPRLRFPISATNLSQGRYFTDFVPITLAQYLKYGDIPSAYDYRKGNITTMQSRTLGTERPNIESTVSFPLTSLIGAPTGGLAYQITTQDRRNGASEYSGILHVSDLGVFAQVFRSSGFVSVTSLNTGMPIPGARIEVRALPNAYASSGKSHMCASGMTDHNGHLYLSKVEMKRCEMIAGPKAASVSFVIITRRGSDWSVLKMPPYFLAPDIGLPGNRVSGSRSRGVLFFDRDVYRRGDTAYATGVSYVVHEDRLLPERNTMYQLSIFDRMDRRIKTVRVRTDAYGVFDLPISIAKSAKLGFYSVSASGPPGGSLRAQYRVAEFQPPNISVDISFARPVMRIGMTQHMNISARYLFGGGVALAPVSIGLDQQVARVTVPGFRRYAFGRQWFWPERLPLNPYRFLSKHLTLNRLGNASVLIPIPSNLPTATDFTVATSVNDVSNHSVFLRKTFTAYPDRDVIGIAGDSIGNVGAPLRIKIVSVRPDGTSDGARRVIVRLQKATMSSNPWLLRAQSSSQMVVYRTVAQRVLTASSSPATVVLVPKDAGTYRVRASFGSVATASDVQVWVSGSQGTFLPGYLDRLQVDLDKAKYRVGDQAAVLVRSPYHHARITVDVVRNSVLWELTRMAGEGDVRIPFPITPHMLPNAAVEVRIVRVGRPLSSLSGTQTPYTLARIGMTAFRVDTSRRRLAVQVTPLHGSLSPGSWQSLNLAMHDAAHRGVSGELVVAVVNEANLELDGYRFPDAHDTVYRDQGIATRFANTFADVPPKNSLREENASRTIFTVGVEKSSVTLSAKFRELLKTGVIRRSFSPLAFFSAHVHTDAYGNARVRFRLPDDLTTWRVMVVGLSHDGRFMGNGEATFLATKAMISNPLLPQFARPGDRFYGGAAVRNASIAGARAQVRIVTTGALTVHGSARIDFTENVPVGMEALRYAMSVGSFAPTTMQVTTSIGSDTDAFLVPLVIRDRAVTQTTIDVGSTNTATTIPLAMSSRGSLRLVIANSAASQFHALARQALSRQASSYADDVAARLTLDAALGNSNAADLAKVASLHRSGGGYGFTTKDKTADPFATSSIVRSLAFARAHGVWTTFNKVDLRYLNAMLAGRSLAPRCADGVCRRRLRFEMLATLAAWGDRRETGLDGIIASAGSFDDATQMRLARYLLALPDYHAKGLAMAQSFVAQTYLSGRFATYNVATPWSWLGNTVASQAQLVRLLAAMHASADDQDAAVRALASQPCRCGWGDLYGTAQALVAVDAYERVSPVKALKIAVRVGSYAHDVSLPAKPASAVVRVPNAALPASAITLTTVGGRMNYIATLTQTVATNAPGALAGIRATRTVRIAGTRKPLAVFDLASQPMPTTLAAGSMVDIGVRIIVDRPLDRIVIEDPLPAGLEAIDGTFAISPQRASVLSDSLEIGDEQIYADRVTAYIGSVGPGVYEMHYFARAVTPGTFRWPGVQATVRDAPEIFGRSATGTLIVK